MSPPCYHYNGFVEVRALSHMIFVCMYKLMDGSMIYVCMYNNIFSAFTRELSIKKYI